VPDGAAVAGEAGEAVLDGVADAGESVLCAPVEAGEAGDEVCGAVPQPVANATMRRTNVGATTRGRARRLPVKLAMVVLLLLSVSDSLLVITVWGNR